MWRERDVMLCLSARRPRCSSWLEGTGWVIGDVTAPSAVSGGEFPLLGLFSWVSPPGCSQSQRLLQHRSTIRQNDHLQGHHHRWERSLTHSECLPRCDPADIFCFFSAFGLKKKKHKKPHSSRLGGAWGLVSIVSFSAQELERLHIASVVLKMTALLSLFTLYRVYTCLGKSLKEL